MKEINLYIIEIIILIFISAIGILGATYYVVNKTDGLENWRRPDGSAIVEVVFDGKTYYCEHAESPAGYPERLVLYRDGGKSYLSLPDKFAVSDPAATE